MDTNISIVNKGDLSYLGSAFAKAENEGKLSIVYLGGSITQGCNASTTEKRYVNQSFAWWKEKFPKADITMFNAGIGATTSQYGAARAPEHVLPHEPDVVFVEFSVNDDDTDFFKETYESLIRRLLSAESVKTVVMINNLFYDNGRNAQRVHNEIGKHYDLPIVSVKNYAWPLVESGDIDPKVYTDDNLHPTDIGHTMIAKLICGLLDVNYEAYKNGESFGKKPALPAKLTACRYEDAEIFRNTNSSPVLDGFTADTHKAEQFCDPFRDGWTASRKGASITFEAEGSIFVLQWRRSVNKPAPIAYAVIDGDEANKVKLDANFEETWGDLSCLTTLTENAAKGKKHTVKIYIAEEGSASDFMVMSLIAADK
ncbi:SGNH/GDSL hydrolase family protein [Ruminococcus sp.]|uniref:SGNH/GDSL hydrolase family protein n=1 Tax=Ruminococcus sp. TaxID=41978 RepID=UPI0025FCF291|nr:SGNH/GDSL hydrolase family protein [Ruminococcus sp.]MBQ8967960.1 SGNH/GDSL hydrolase family protein [Ruminococcus sp.]